MKHHATRIFALGLSLLSFLCFAPLVRGEEKLALGEQFLKALKPRSLGPANMSGRIVDVAVYEKKPSVMYVASASGGLWKTMNNGTTWTPVFERENTVALGAVAVSQTNPDIVWVGTGEANPRNSVSWGDGVYKSVNGGKSWQNMGLRDSQHIGRICVHPTNPEIVYVAALGHVWGPNRERGLYKTINGGRTWQQVKYVNDETGFVDLVMDPSEPDTLYAAAYPVRRDAFSGGNPLVQFGAGGGLFKTSDGGATWQKMAGGLPDRPIGRCGLSVSRSDPNILYAVVQTDLTSTTVSGQAENLKSRTLKDAKGKDAKRPIGPEDGGVFMSADKGRTWTQVNSLCPRPFYYGQIRVDPNDANRVYVLGIQFNVSTDGGKTFKAPDLKNVHSDLHALWIDPKDSNHLVLGCDGGLYFSYDRGGNWEHLRNLPVAQFYAIGLDMSAPYWIYGGLQDNGTWGGPSATRSVAGILPSDWLNLLGFDGYYCQADPKDPYIVYCEGQYGILRRVNMRAGEATDIKPRLQGKSKKGPNLETNIVPEPPQGTPGFRFNWCSPILLSEHDNRTVYFGGNMLFRSNNQGDGWRIISPDLTRAQPGPQSDGGHTITTIAESPLKAGLIYVGSDDGRVHLTRDRGGRWTDLTDKILDVPAARHISRLECSRFAEGAAFLAIDRHRNDDRTPYLFKTTDYGETWKSIRANLPAGGPVYVVRQDPRNPDLLYVGTEFGLFISNDGGASWHKHPGLPTVPVHDVVVHPRDRELVVGTHGRGIYIVDVRPLQDFKPEVLRAQAHLFDVAPALAFRPQAYRRSASNMFVGENPPYGATLYVHLKEAPAATPTVTITDGEGRELVVLKGAKEAGLQRLNWRLQASGAGPPFGFRPLPAGTYTATLRVGKQQMAKTIEVRGAQGE